ncbi:MAG TPA: DUF1727 domain-containing protein [Candidatus Aphodovivens avistercoris]|nr:DUF1727 domain-containing protein [Candidatus Aphodovivens avistercoris]
MGARLFCARAVAALSTWGLKHVFHRPAANFPGKIALYVDPRVIAHLADKAAEGSIVVVGTNGKTTVTNLLADAFEAAGKRVICNRTGANLDSGVATALLHAGAADVGVFESDELWLAKTAPQLKPRYIILLNLFRDQLDRVGEIDRIQDSIVGALGATPSSTLVFNADDPLCAAIAARVSNPAIAFGVEGDMGLTQNTVADAQMCQRCSTMMDYAFRQYGQLGEYRCPTCGFARPARDWSATGVRLEAEGLSFSVEHVEGAAEQAQPAAAEAPVSASAASGASDPAPSFPLHASFSGAYMVYNLLAVAVGARLGGVDPAAIQRAIDAFDPRNGRLQRFSVQGRPVLLNLAKNPTGFNQNIKIILQDKGPKTVAFFINDKEADGHDVSWLWDIDFEELAGQKELRAFAGGIRGNDMQVRLKYAGIQSELAQGAADVLAKSAVDERGGHVYLIANYTALPALHAELTRLADAEAAAPTDVPAAETAAPDAAPAPTSAPAPQPAAISDEPPLVIAHLFPDLLNLYGDGGNVTVLAYRTRMRGIPVEVRRVKHGQSINLADADLVFLGGGPDREQRLASEALLHMKDDLARFVEENGVLLAICGGYQILGREWLLGDDVVEGLGIIDMTTQRAEGGSGNRLIDNVILRSPVAARPVVGYENHAGRTHLGAGVSPFGTVASSTGHGNNDTDKSDGVLHRNVLGTYLHGPLLAKNPEVADWLLACALERRAARTGQSACALTPLDDAAEEAANEALCRRFGAK